MPSMADISVVKYSGTESVVYNALTGAGSDASPAVWRQDTGASASLPIGMRALFWLKSLWNGPKTARRLPFRYEHPYAIQDTATGKWSVPDRLVIDGFVLVPQGMPTSFITDGVTQGLRILGSSLLIESMIAGYAPHQ